MRVGFADQNGWRYHSIGQWLITHGHLSAHELSMQRIRSWAKANPSKVKAALAQNPSYIFFEERKSDTELGPIGAAGVPLTPEASVAVDQNTGNSVHLSLFPSLKSGLHWRLPNR